MSLLQNEFLEFIKLVFKNNGADYESLLNKPLGDESDKMQILCHFYYFICMPEKNAVREELRIIGMTSLMEAMMSEKYVSPFEYLKDIPKEKIIENYQEVENDYFNNYGLINKVKKYMIKYISDSDKDFLISKIKIFDETMNPKEHRNLYNIEEFAGLLYDMRSEFVHSGKMHCFCPANVMAISISAKNAHYYMKIGIDEILKIFEKSFVKYWTENRNN